MDQNNDDIYSGASRTGDMSSPATPQATSASANDDIYSGATKTEDHTPASQPSTQTQEDPGFWSRFHENGPTGAVSQVWNLVKAGNAYDKQHPNNVMDNYHNMMDAVHKGNYKEATKAAAKLVSGGVLNPDHPIYKAAEQIITSPFQELGKAAKYVEAAERHIEPGGGLKVPGADDAEISGMDKGSFGSNISAALHHGLEAVPVVGKPMAQAGDDWNQGHIAAGVGDLAGMFSTLGLSKIMSGGSEAAADTAQGTEGLNSVRPGTIDVAGEKIPVASNTPNLGKQSLGSKIASAAATPEGAAKFVNEQVAPAARNATHATFAQSAIDDVDRFHQLRGEQAPTPPKMGSANDVADYLKENAQKTYQTLDQVGEADQKAWIADRNELLKDARSQAEEESVAAQIRAKEATSVAEKAKRDLESSAPKEGEASTPESKDAYKSMQDRVKGLMDKAKEAKQAAKDASDLDSVAEQKVEAQMPQDSMPLKFTELRTRIRSMESILKSKVSSMTDKEMATKWLPKLYKDLNDFTTKHGDAIAPGELKAADAMYAKSSRYRWISQQLHRASQGVGDGGGIFRDSPLSYKVQQLRNLPGRFKAKFGETAWDDLLGQEGVSNYQRILGALENPVTGNKFMNVLKSLPAGVGEFTRAGSNATVGKFADSILFNPDAGSKLLKILGDVGEAAGAVASKASPRNLATAGLRTGAVMNGAGVQSTQSAPAVGTVMQGYRFTGGDPSKESSWTLVQ